MIKIIILIGALLMSVYNKAENGEQSIVTDEQVYSEFLSGDRTLLVEEQSQMWLPDFQDSDMKYEYTYLDVDQDNVEELLVQLENDPCGYNGVFHFENGRIYCWNSDSVDMTCRDYPLQNGMMVRQYDYAGTRSYILFRYMKNGEMESISSLFVREELISEDSLEKCPYYEIDGQEVDKAEFDKQFDLLITDWLLEREAWTPI